jgi:uncharacterized membrane protein
MDWLVLLKLIHVLSAIVAVGANVTYAFWLRLAGHDRERLTFAIRSIHWIDMRLANPAYGVLLVTGVLMVIGGLYSFETGWIAAAIVLYVAAVVIGIALYAPAIRRQLAAAEADPTSAAYDDAARRSNLLGGVTMVIVLVIVVLMVTKPI